jgi:Zn-dependent protease
MIHEIAHGAVAYHLGDPTAKNEGRLNLNPLNHLDPIGSIILPAFLFLMTSVTGVGLIFGWAKPVPINPYNFRDQKYGSLKVAAAGPSVNIALALVFGLALRFFPEFLYSFSPVMILLFSYIVLINLQLAVFNLIPIPPLDGSHILFTLLPRSFDKLKLFLYSSGFFLLIIIMLFFFRYIIYIINIIFTLIVGQPLF